jgi:hypothetical protein
MLRLAMCVMRKKRAFGTGSQLLAAVGLLMALSSHVRAVVAEHPPDSKINYLKGVVYSQRHLSPDTQAVVDRSNAGDWSGLTIHSGISDALGSKPGTMTELKNTDLIWEEPLRNSLGVAIYPPADFDVIRYPKGTAEYRRACKV